MDGKVFYSIVYLLAIGYWLAEDTKPNEQALMVWTRDAAVVPYKANDDSILLERDRAGVVFLSNEQLMVYAVEPTNHLSSRKSPGISSAFQLTLNLVDAGSGSRVLEKHWGTRLRGSAVQTTRSGVLIKTGGIMKIYSTDFATVTDLPISTEPNGIYFTSVSSSGQKLAVNYYTKREHRYLSHIDVLDADTLATRASWDEYPPLFGFSMSDNSFLTMERDSLTLRAFGNDRTDGTALLDYSKVGCAAGRGAATLVFDDQTILRDCNGVVLLERNAQPFAIEAFDGRGASEVRIEACEPYNPDRVGRVSVSANGSFAALSLPTVKVKRNLLGEGRTCLVGIQIAIYDVKRRQRISSLRVEPLPAKMFDFALSPDGSRVAVLSGSLLSMWDVRASRLQ